MVLLLDPPSPVRRCDFLDVRHVCQRDYLEIHPILVLSSCNADRKENIAQELRSSRSKEVQRLLQGVATKLHVDVVLLLVHMGDETGLQDELTRIGQAHMTAGIYNFTILVVSGKALQRHLPAVVTRPHLFPELGI